MAGEHFGELFEHQAWVRALAARLCAPGDTDDLIQDTWVEALRAGPRARSPRAWLGGVVRHLRRRTRRSEAARAQREQRVAREAHTPSPELLLARAELQRRVLAAVAGLGEPYRVVVLMHYYEGCTSEAIAERLGCPSSTVRNRLARAHRQLRAQLDRDQEGGGAAWSALFAPAAGSGQGLVLGGIVMKVHVVAAAAVALAATAWFVLDRASSPALRPPGPAASTPLAAVAATAPLAALGTVASPGSERTPARGAQVEHVLVWGALHGGERLESGQIELYDALERPHAAAVGANATWSIFGIAPGRYRIRARFERHLPLDEELFLGDETDEVQHDLTLVPSRVLPVRFVARESGADLMLPLSRRSELSVIATLERPGASLAGVADTDVAWYAEGRFHRPGFGGEEERIVPEGFHGALEVLTPQSVWASCVLRSEVLESRWLRGGEAELVFALDPAEIESRRGSITVRCVDGRTGEPLACAWLRTSFRNGGGGDTPRTGPDGQFTLTELAPGMQIVELGAKDFASHRRWVRVAPGETFDLGTIELLPTVPRLAGRVLDQAGVGVAAGIVAVPLRRLGAPRALDGLGQSRSRLDGAFELFGVERGPARLLVTHADWALAALDIDGASEEGLEIRLERGTDVALRTPPGAHTAVECLLLDGSGQPLFFARVATSRRLKLRSGRYELCMVVDETIVARRALDVGETPLVVEVGGAR